ncbi:hypothetical protein PVMG_05354 [Plasmodium vivax Mauritania I]|uniref:Uncharacterized protein n=1 Tax=Plasmodium vivax Mauritania I TaxID=1035515 RepID=A0A0J9TJ93_PLAVI|nr:hypothetical protein PVMG_05354 [Plasmodium vivax Mauritania I]
MFVNLLKNLKYSNEQLESTKDTVNCRYLYQWIYHTTKQLDYLETIISILFKTFNEQFYSTSNPRICPYYSYKTYKEDSENLIKLHICEDNIFNIQGILKDPKEENRCLGRKILYECVNIYKKINENYCLTGKDTSTNEICSQLGTFKLFYTSYISSAAGIKEEIPSLHTPINIFNDQCSLNAQTKAPSREEDDNPGRSIPQRVPSALGVIAGVPPLLAVIYKVNNIII